MKPKQYIGKQGTYTIKDARENEVRVPVVITDHKKGPGGDLWKVEGLESAYIEKDWVRNISLHESKS